MTYKIVRFYDNPDKHQRAHATGLTLEEARAWCADPEHSSATCRLPQNRAHTKEHGPWFDGFTKE